MPELDRGSPWHRHEFYEGNGGFRLIGWGSNERGSNPHLVGATKWFWNVAKALSHLESSGCPGGRGPPNSSIRLSWFRLNVFSVFCANPVGKLLFHATTWKMIRFRPNSFPKIGLKTRKSSLLFWSHLNKSDKLFVLREI